MRKPNVGTATNEEEPTDREANNIEDNVMEEGDSDEEAVSDGKHQHIAIYDVVKIRDKDFGFLWCSCTHTEPCCCKIIVLMRYTGCFFSSF